ncbi:MAG: hypothetical protein IIC29_06855 [Chloroflexi bacterium]|nr:hypothetical protein [Chloroflexota bacterium]
MISERMKRQIDLLLDQAEAALAERDWHVVDEIARSVLSFDPDNADAHGLLTLSAPHMDGEAEEPTPAAAARVSTSDRSS